MLSTHCHIHRVALASKVTSDGIEETINLTVKIFNFIKTSPLNSRLFEVM